VSKSLQQNLRLHLITYNLRRHTAYGDVAELIRDHSPDMICLQECHTSKLADTIGDMSIAAKSKIGKSGLAVYAKTGNYAVVSSASYVLQRSIYEFVIREVRQRLLVVQLQDTETGKAFVVSCLHATHPVATNLHRRRQIRRVVKLLAPYAGQPHIIMGDFNHPFFPRQLQRFMRRLKFDLVLPPQITYKEKYFKGYFDFAATQDCTATKAEVLEQKNSDHLPVLVEVSI
jgi:exodeoxyribonuclease-3